MTEKVKRRELAKIIEGCLLKIKKKYFCPKAFCEIHAVSLPKLYNVVKNPNMEEEEHLQMISTEEVQTETKKDQIKTFLLGIWNDDAQSELVCG